MLNEAHTCPAGSSPKVSCRACTGGAIDTFVWRRRRIARSLTATGYYPAESSFGELIREALHPGFTIYGYDDYGANRDSLQATHIDELVFRRDPQARAFILAGHGHIHNTGNILYRHLKALTGLDHIAFDQDIQREKPAPAYELAVYRDFFRPQGRTTPAILTGAPPDPGREVSIYTPPTQTVHGRPHRLLEGGPRKAVPIPIDGPAIVKAYYASEAAELSVDGRPLVPPADRPVVEAIGPENDGHFLILKPGRCLLQYRSPEGVLAGQREKEVE